MYVKLPHFFAFFVEYNAYHTLAFYFIIQKESVIIESKSKTRKNYLIEDSVRMVQMGLTPSEALRACNHPCSKQKLSYELTGAHRISYQ